MLHEAMELLDPVIHQSYVTTGGQIIIAILVTVLPLVVGQGVVNGRRAKQAVAQTAKTGNGYASRTEEALRRIEQHLETQGRRLDTLTDRFNRHIDPKD